MSGSMGYRLNVTVCIAKRILTNRHPKALSHGLGGLIVISEDEVKDNLERPS